jgi:hypothetical protein
MLWPPSGLRIERDRIYAFSTDRAAYAIRLR